MSGQGLSPALPQFPHLARSQRETETNFPQDSFRNPQGILFPIDLDMLPLKVNFLRRSEIMLPIPSALPSAFPETAGFNKILVSLPLLFKNIAKPTQNGPGVNQIGRFSPQINAITAPGVIPLLIRV